MPRNCRLVIKVNIWAVASRDRKLQMPWGTLKAEQMLCSGGALSCPTLHVESHFSEAVVFPVV